MENYPIIIPKKKKTIESTICVKETKWNFTKSIKFYTWNQNIWSSLNLKNTKFEYLLNPKITKSEFIKSKSSKSEI